MFSLFKYATFEVGDGWGCDPRDPWKVCADGYCLPTGCDNVLASDIRTDACGNCGGGDDEEFCQFVSQSYDNEEKRQEASNEMLLPNYHLLSSIPRGSKDTRISSVSSTSFLGQNEWLSTAAAY